MSKCTVCGRSMFDGHPLFRNNEKGVPAVWRCRDHLDKKPDEEVEDIVRILSGKEDTP